MRFLRTFCPKIAIFSQFQVHLSITQAKQITNLLLLHNFYPVISYRRVQKKKKATNCCYTVRSLVMVRSQLSAQVVNLSRWNNVPRTLRTFCPKIAIFSQFQVHLSITQAKQITNLLLLNNFYPVISYRRVQKKKKATNCCYTVRSLVMVRSQLHSASG